MATAQIVQGETPTYTTSGPGGNIINNDVHIRTTKNLGMVVTDLQQGNVHGLNMLVENATATGASGTNLFSIPNYTTDGVSIYDNGIAYDGINVTSTGAITGVGITFPLPNNQGQTFRLMFDVAVTTLTLVPTGGVTILNPATSAAAFSFLNYTLIGSMWKNF
jgi:hypothetical protein